MKKHLLLLLLLIPFLLGSGPTVIVDGDPQVTGNPTFYGRIYRWAHSITSEVSEKTTANITLYVRTTGLDTNDCQSAANACLTIQEAVDRIPKNIKHVVTIDVGPGSFAGFYVTGFTVEWPDGDFQIEGTLANHTPGTGTGSGTADGGDTDTCIDSGQAWTGDALIGKMVLVNGEYRFIRDNDGTSIDLVGVLSATCNGKAYQLIEYDTKLDSFPADNAYAYIEGYGNTVSEPNSTAIWFRNFEVDGQSNFYEAFWFWGTAGMNVERIYSYDNYWGGGWQNVWGRQYANDLWFENGWTYAQIYYVQSESFVGSRFMLKSGGADGFRVEIGKYLELNEVYADSCAAYGIACIGIKYGSIADAVLDGNDVGFYAYDSSSIDFDSSITVENSVDDGIRLSRVMFGDIDTGTISSNGGWGIIVDEDISGDKSALSSLNMVGNITVATNTDGGIYGKNNSIIHMSNVDGANNGAYGLQLGMNSSATITSATGITGATADATINDGTTDLTWATDFDDDGDTAVNLDNGCRIKRTD